MNALEMFGFLYFGVAVLTAMITGLETHKELDALIIGIFWPLFAVKKAIKLLFGWE